MQRLLPLASFLLLASCAETPSDQRLQEAVEQSIHQNPALLADHLKVRSENGVIYLYGLVATYVEYVDVEKLAKATPGVKQVVNATSVDNSRF
jgi:osmotically-inducible protein OsmY